MLLSSNKIKKSVSMEILPPLPVPPAVAEISLVFFNLISWEEIVMFPPSPDAVVAVIWLKLFKSIVLAVMVKFPACPNPSFLTVTCPWLIILKSLVFRTISPELPNGTFKLNWSLNAPVGISAEVTIRLILSSLKSLEIEGLLISINSSATRFILPAFPSPTVVALISPPSCKKTFFVLRTILPPAP
ncbi:hypothetical protein CWATWH0402_5821 [Crocosphaera watsonii WH 0402]|uniref:Uncharacterized protein n=1 Tax=Crocosphaera watsonii WH 0402 TaxID=1284629 RepID=T2JQI3_CROWT|nr:hypothetical protein CWATWH0402_5821 [Crocosphaera watsonii WH 0402]